MPVIAHGGLLGSLPRSLARVLFALAVSVFAVFGASFAAAVRAVHEVPWWRALVALGVSVLVTGVLFGLLPPELPFGTRVLVQLHPATIHLWVD